MISLVDSEGKSQDGGTVAGPRGQPGQREQDGRSLLRVILPKPRTDRWSHGFNFMEKSGFVKESEIFMCYILSKQLKWAEIDSKGK